MDRGGSDGPPDIVDLARLLDTALELDADERTAWLADLGRVDPAGAASVASLLAREAQLAAGGFLDRNATLDTFAVPTLGGQEIGPYTLLRPLGHGGMGAVWLARRSDGRYEAEVAVKLLNLSLLGPTGRERFRREGSTLARLTHPNIAHLIDAGVTPLGQPYLVLERVDGVPIDEYCNRRRLTPEQRLRLFGQVLAAVDHAHASLVVHRDIKPSNILVTDDGTVKLLDFGIAKLLEADGGASGRTELTDVGGTLLTPEYAAPEQITGEPVTAATDVYALGVLLYLLLAGIHPTARARRPGSEHLRDLVEREPLRLGAAITAAGAPMRSTSLPRLRRLYGGDIGTIVGRALEKDPARRYATAAALRDDMERFLRHEPILARPAGRLYRLRKFARRNRLTVAIGALAALSLVTGTAVASVQMLEARRQRDAAESQRDRALYESRRAAAASGVMLALVSGLHPEEKASPLDLVQHARAVLERDHAADPEFTTRMLLELADEFGGTIPLRDMGAMLGRAVEVAESTRRPELMALAGCTLAWFRLRTYVDPDSGRAHLARADAILSGMADPDPAAQERCLLVEMRLRWLEGARDSARVLSHLVLARAETGRDTASPAFGRLLTTLAEQHLYFGNYRNALDLSRRAGRIFRRSGRGETAQTLDALAIESGSLEALDPSASDSVFRRWARLSQRLGRASAAAIENRTVHHALSIGWPDSAARILSAGIAREPVGSPGYTDKLFWLVRAHIHAGRLGDARRALADLRRVPAISSMELLLLDGDLAEAERKFDLALARFREILAADGYPNLRRESAFWPYVARAGEMAFRIGALASADSFTSRAYEFSQRVSPENQLRAGRIRLLQGRVRAARGDTVAAIRFAHEAITALETRTGSPSLRLGELESARKFLSELPAPASTRRDAAPRAS